MVTQIGDAKVTLDLPTTIFLGEPSFVRCSVNNLENSPKQIRSLNLYLKSVLLIIPEKFIAQDN